MVEFRYDNSGGTVRAYYRTTGVHDEAGVPVLADRSSIYLWNDGRYYQYWKTPSIDHSEVFLSVSPEHIRHTIAIMYDGAGPVLGILYGDLDRFDSILRQADSISVRGDLEKVRSEDCYVIDARSTHGDYTVWLDPKHGYGLAKAQVYRGPEHLRFGRPRSSYKEADDVSTFALSNVRFENMEDTWVPMEVDCHLTTTLPAENRTVISDVHYATARITLNPDHVRLRSFTPDIENGTRVRLEEAPGIRYTWRDGTVVTDIDDSVVWDIDRAVDDLRAKEQGPIGQTVQERGVVAPDEPTTPVRPPAERDKHAAGPQRHWPANLHSVAWALILVSGCIALGIVTWRFLRRTTP